MVMLLVLASGGSDNNFKYDAREEKRPVDGYGRALAVRSEQQLASRLEGRERLAAIRRGG